MKSIGISACERLEPEARADVLFAFQLLEHLADASTLLSAAAAVLVTDGRLILSVPNAGEADIVGPTWVGFRVDLEHLNYFTLRSLAALCARHGLLIEQFWLSTQPALSRAFAPTAKTTFATLRSILSGAASSTLGVGDRINDGTFVLAVLARKVATAHSTPPLIS